MMSEERVGSEDDITMSDNEKDDGDTDVMTSSNSVDEPPALQPDEVYCTSCGEPIKEKAAICPQCGVPQSVEDEINGMGGTGGHSEFANAEIPPEKAYELRKLAQKNVGLVALVGFTFTPVAYLMVGKPWWAALNFLTLNYFLLGFVFVPLHTWMIITNARKELDEHGVAW